MVYADFSSTLRHQIEGNFFNRYAIRCIRLTSKNCYYFSGLLNHGITAGLVSQENINKKIVKGSSFNFRTMCPIVPIVVQK
jgi:hypothetical protein